MKGRIDPRLCQRTGYCVPIAPALFRLSPDGGPTDVVVEDVPRDLQELALEAEGICPANAVSADEER